MNIYKNKANLVISEIQKSLFNVPDIQTKKLINEILKAKKVFLVAVGRVNLSLQCFGKRLSHLGIEVELVGSLTEKPATKKDLLLVASGSGESIVPLEVARKAKNIGCKIALITSAKKSSLRKISNFVVEIKAPTKIVKRTIIESLSDKASKPKASYQPMSSLFDQALHIYGDVVSILIIEKLRINKKMLWKYHANLE
jgi:6-phospho-3-hexuloisomerase